MRNATTRGACCDGWRVAGAVARACQRPAARQIHDEGHDAEHVKGTSTFTFAKGGTYTIAQGGAVVVHGHYAALGSEITLSRETGSRACPQFGDYHWKRTGKTLKPTRVSDPCAGRALVLGHTFTVAG